MGVTGSPPSPSVAAGCCTAERPDQAGPQRHRAAQRAGRALPVDQPAGKRAGGQPAARALLGMASFAVQPCFFNCLPTVFATVCCRQPALLAWAARPANWHPPLPTPVAAPTPCPASPQELDLSRNPWLPASSASSLASASRLRRLSLAHTLPRDGHLPLSVAGLQHLTFLDIGYIAISQ